MEADSGTIDPECADPHMGGRLSRDSTGHSPNEKTRVEAVNALRAEKDLTTESQACRITQLQRESDNCTRGSRAAKHLFRRLAPADDNGEAQTMYGDA